MGQKGFIVKFKTEKSHMKYIRNEHRQKENRKDKEKKKEKEK